MSASDDGFGTTATLEVEVDGRSLNNVKQQIESEIGTTEVGVADGGSMSAQVAGGGAAGGRERRRRRREYRWARERTDYLEEVVGYLEDIEDKVGGGGGILDDLLGGCAVAGLLGGARIEAVAGFQTFAQALDEPGGRRSVDDVVVDGDGQAQELPGTEFPVDQAGLGADAADG